MGLKIFIDFAVPADLLHTLKKVTEGHELVFPKHPVESVLAKAEWDPELETADIVIGQPDLESIERARQLKWIHVSSSGITRYDNPAFRAKMVGRGITVTNSANVYNQACADHALSFMLAQSRQLPLGLRTRTPGGSEAWNNIRSSSVPLRGQSILIVGYGAIGKRLTQLLRPFEMNILAYRRQARGDETVPVISTKAEFIKAAGQADHIMNILPDSVETRKFFAADCFSSLKRGAIFYNIGRGATVDQGALLDSLSSGYLKAAWLDVTEPEPLPEDHPLWRQPNCHITPHVAGGHLNETGTLVNHFLANFKNFIQNVPLVDRIL